MKNKRGFILLLSFFMMAGLILMVAGLLYLVSYETRDVGIQVEDTKILNLAEAGVQRAKREIRDDYLTTTQTGTADLRGATATVGGGFIPDIGNIIYEEDGYTTIGPVADAALLSDFEKNYTHTRIVNVLLGVLASKPGGGPPGSLQLEVAYSTTGTFPEAGNTALITPGLSSTPTEYPQDITNDRSWTWAIIMNSNFTLQAQNYSGGGSIRVDYMFLRVVYEIDTNTEPWFTGSYATFPITLGAGTIQSVSITAEQGKVHLNTATQGLLRYLMVENGIPDGTASQVATNIVTYRNGIVPNQFDTIEELKQVTDMTDTIYNAIDQDITVYSYINTFAQGPPGIRAPVNINTASSQVLKAIFDPLTFDNASDIPALADAIIAQRSTPFTCFYSFLTSVTTDFFGFIMIQSYLSDAEKDSVLGNADASLLVPREGGTDQPALTTEFSYDTNAFKIESVGNMGGVGGRNIRVKTILDDSGATTFFTFSGDSTSVGWRKENFE